MLSALARAKIIKTNSVFDPKNPNIGLCTTKYDVGQNFHIYICLPRRLISFYPTAFLKACLILRRRKKVFAFIFLKRLADNLNKG